MTQQDAWIVTKWDEFGEPLLRERVAPPVETPQPAIPAGMVLVPVSMAEDTCPCCCQWSEDHSQAMLAAAPKPENSHDRR